MIAVACAWLWFWLCLIVAGSLTQHVTGTEGWNVWLRLVVDSFGMLGASGLILSGGSPALTQPRMTCSLVLVVVVGCDWLWLVLAGVDGFRIMLVVGRE